jgi:subtilisin family serine protease
MGRVSSRIHGQILVSIFSLLALAACDNSGQKTFLPVVSKVDGKVRAISAEEAKTVCPSNYCEDNQIYVTHFGGHHHSDAPAAPAGPTKIPGGAAPTSQPYAMPPQPSEMVDWSRGVMNAQTAWNITEGSPNVIVAVIDSGVDYFHPDLRDNIATNAPAAPGFVGDTYGYDFYHDQVNAWDENGHGTHTSGIIAAEKNGIGVRGIAPRVKILPVKFLGPDGSGDTADAVRAIDYAVARGAKILSNSWGGGGYSQLLDDAVQRAINKGVVFVAAAGNDSVNTDAAPTYPADYAGVVAVGSSDASDLRSSFSNYGKATVEVFAPGTSILSTYPGGTYRTESGTSMATPQVSGALALAFSVAPNLTAAEAIADLCATSASRLSDVSKCGRMDIGAFIQKVSGR